jgi:uncharacterized protein (DUF488 family)
MAAAREAPMPDSGVQSVYTIGHSNHPIERFIELLQQHEVTLVADVRTLPASRFQPQFSRAALTRTLETAGIAYLFLGDALGGRPRDQERDYERMAEAPAFVEGIRRVREEAPRHRVALVCAERDPMDCHRALLVSRALARGGLPVIHIHYDGSTETHEAFEARLLQSADLAEDDLLEPREARLARAYRLRGTHAATGRR